MSTRVSPSQVFGSGCLSPLPREVHPRLIDVGILHLEASRGGSRERYRRGETAQTVHVWWARRPHRAMRALAFACLTRERSPRAVTVMEALSGAIDSSADNWDLARELVARSYAERPRLLDMFGGGGTIGLEAAKLGAETHAIDVNRLSVFIQQNLLVDSQNCKNDLSEILESSGRKVLAGLKRDTEVLFPCREKTFGYFWTYQTFCPRCKFKFFLSKRPWLSKKRDPPTALVTSNGGRGQQVVVKTVNLKFSHPSVWKKRQRSVTCPHCQTTISEISIDRTHDVLVAMVGQKKPHGKKFFDASPAALPSDALLECCEREVLQALGAQLPTSILPDWSGIVNPAIYGVKTHADFLNRRQRVVLLLLIKRLVDEFVWLRNQRGETCARAAIGLLSGLIDQLVDWNCRFSMWIPQNEQVGRAFCGPGVAMLWDYVETDPLLNGPANLWDKLTRITAGFASIGSLEQTPYVKQAAAQQLPYPDQFFDCIVTDPPYYDNVYYNVLADFFYSWKRLLLVKIVPDLFTAWETDTQYDLVASTHRSPVPEQAHDDYCRQLAQVLQEASRVMKENAVFALVYSHGSVWGWEALLRAYREASLVVTSVQPLAIERRQRPRAMSATVVNACVVVVARRSSVPKQVVSLEVLVPRLRSEVVGIGEKLRDAGWQEADIGLAAYAQGVGLLANVAAVSNCADPGDQLELCEQLVRATFPRFSLTRRRSL